MITVDEAKKILSSTLQELKNLRAVSLPLGQALGHVTISPVLSPLASPLFDNSAMDGFALSAEQTIQASESSPVNLRIAGEIKAGEAPMNQLQADTAIRIMTGAAIPSGTNAVVKKEDVTQKNGMIQLIKPVKEGNNIRKKGEDFGPGDRVLKEGTCINPGIVGLLASIGVKNIDVWALPRVSILTTGHELVLAIEDLAPGKIMESNGAFLNAALKVDRILPVRCLVIDDDPALIHKHLANAVEDSDIVILTGGVSVGEHDYTRDVLGLFGVKQLFWKVAQKPGKPFYAGLLGEKLFFGLPGNPYAVFVTYYFYIRPVLLALMGIPNADLSALPARLTRSFFKRDQDRTHFLKGKTLKKEGILFVDILKGQGSHLLGSLADADCLVEVPAEVTSLKEGDEVKIHFLP